MSTALAVVENITAIEFFKPGASKPLLESVKKEARELAATFDVSTPAGEDGIRSLAAKLGKVKNKIENEGKALVADEKAQLKVIDVERGIVWDEMEDLQKEIRQPLTDKETAEKVRISNHETNLAEMVAAGTQNWEVMSTEDMRASLQKIADSEYNWQEFHSRAVAVMTVTIQNLKQAISRREKADADAAELEALRAAQAKRDQEEREARIAQEAKDAAEAVARKREAEQRAAAEEERQRIEDERIQAEARAKQAEAERVAAEEKAKQDAIDAENRLQEQQLRAREAEEKAAREAAEAEQRHAEAIEAAQIRAKAAAEQAEKDKAEALQSAKDMAERARQAAVLRAEIAAQEKQSAIEDERERAALAARDADAAAEASRKAAVEAERTRAAEETRKAQEEATKREANRKHAAKINGEVRDAIIKAASDASIVELTEIQATAIVVAIAKGLIPHTKISY